MRTRTPSSGGTRSLPKWEWGIAPRGGLELAEGAGTAVPEREALEEPF